MNTILPPPIHCDRCPTTAVVTCGCRRCQSEPELDERFHACVGHQSDVAAAHQRVRGYAFVPTRI